MNRKTLIISSVAAALVGSLLLVAMLRTDPFAFAGGHRVSLADYHGQDPTGVPPELKTASLIQRGEYLTRAADCESCHTAPDGVPFAGGLAFETPFGVLYSSNITPDEAVGIGAYSDVDFLGAVRRGIRRDGARLYPAMPYVSYAYMSDDDLLAIKAYLFTLKPSSSRPRENRLTFPFNQRPLMAAWSLLFNADRRFEPNLDRSAQWNRGAYLVEAVAHCGECHTPRNLLQALNNSRKFSGAEIDDWSAYNITADHDTGLGSWSDAALTSYLSDGRAKGHGAAAGPMGEAVSTGLSHLAHDDIAAMVVYLRAIPAISEPDLPAPKVDERSTGNADPHAKAVFEHACAECHGNDGVSPLGDAMTLRGTRTVNDPSGTNIVEIMLNGAHDSKSMMPAFVDILSDSDMAALANYVTGQFGAKSSSVSAARVATLRANWSRARQHQDEPLTQFIPANVATHPAPQQPLPFSHRFHVGLGLDCQSCHTNSNTIADMTLPPTSICMTCHTAVAKQDVAIRQLTASDRTGQIIPWVRVYPLTPGVTFDHGSHLRAGVQCATCHGPIADEEKTVEMTALTSMATCISCHAANHAPTTCATCHAWPNAQPDVLGRFDEPTNLPFFGPSPTETAKSIHQLLKSDSSATPTKTH